MAFRGASEQPDGVRTPEQLGAAVSSPPGPATLARHSGWLQVEDGLDLWAGYCLLWAALCSLLSSRGKGWWLLLTKTQDKKVSRFKRDRSD